MTLSSPESGTPRRSARKAPGQLTPAQSAVLAYAAARAARGLAPQTCHGEGARAAAAAYAAREAERPASTPGKASRRRAHTVEDYILCAATEARPRVRAHAGTPAARPRRLFKAQALSAEDARCDASADCATPTRLHVSLRVDDTGAAVVCELRLEQEAAGGGPSVDELAAALAERLSLRQARVRAPSLTPEVQRLSYLGFCAELRAHVAARGTNTLTTAAVRRWMTTAPEAGNFVDRLIAAHGVASFADLQIDHIVSARFGGADSLYNYFVLPRALNASFNSDVSREKVDQYMGRAVARVVTAFCAFTRAAAASRVDYNAFEQQLLMHILRAAASMATPAAPDFSAVSALCAKVHELTRKGHSARAAEKLSDVIVAAKALNQTDCLIVAYLQCVRANLLVSQAGDEPPARGAQLEREAYMQLHPAAMATLERRRRADTLLFCRCRPYEEAFFEGERRREARNPSTPALAAPLVGYVTYMMAAWLALRRMHICPGSGQELPLTSMETRRLDSFVLCALEMASFRRPIEHVGMIEETSFLNDAWQVAESFAQPDVVVPAAGAAFLSAWARVVSSGALERRNIRGYADHFICRTIAEGAAASAEAAVFGLRACALARCGAKEVHTAQFKKCGACKQAVYCCKEHQKEHWPSHKAACKAARQAAEAAQAGNAS